MDPITQGLAGAAVSQAIGIRKLKVYALIIGFIAGTVPDLDLFIRSHNPTTFLVYHRQFTHSYVFILLGGVLVAGVCLALFKKIRPHWKLVVLTAVLAYATHGVIDGLTSYGTELYWPFSNTRVTWDIMAIIDPALTIGLFVGVVVSVLNTSRTPAVFAIIYFCLYVAFMSVHHYRAEHLLLSQFKQNGRPQHLRVMPLLGAQLNWYVVYRKDKRIFVEEVKTPLFSSVKSIKRFSVPHFTEDQLPAWIKSNPKALKDFRVVNWFADGYLTRVRKKPFLVADLRFGTHPPAAFWGFKFIREKKDYKLIWVRRVQLPMAKAVEQ